MGHPPDENLPEVVQNTYPEVVPDNSPQALTRQEAYAHQQALDGYPKFANETVDSPKYTEVPVGLESAYYHDHMRDPNSGVPWEPQSAVDGLNGGMADGSQYPAPESEKHDEEKIWGLKKRPFYILLALLLVIIAAGIGAGVGGGLAATRSQGTSGGQSSGQSSGASSSPGPSPTDNTDPSYTRTGSSPTPKPTMLNETVGTMPYQFQGWSNHNFTGNFTKIIRQDGFTDLPFPVLSYIWRTDGYTCCITFCKNATDTDGNFRCVSWDRPVASGAFQRIHTYCGGAEITKEAQGCS